MQGCPWGNKLALSCFCTEPYDVSPAVVRSVWKPDKLTIRNRAELTIYLKSRTTVFLKIMTRKESIGPALHLIDGRGLFDLQRNEDI